MVPTDAVINFRFKNAKETDIQKFPFSGTSISVKELKNFISSKHKLDQRSSRPDKTQAPSELSIEDLATGKVYISDEADIPNGATVIVARKLVGGGDGNVDVIEPANSPAEPPITQPAKPLGTKKVIQRSASDLHEKQLYQNSESNPVSASQNGSLSTGGLNDPKWAEMGFVDTIKKTTDVSELDWSDDKKAFALQYQCLLFYDHTVFTRVARPSQNALCNKCGGYGHWPKNCPNSGDYQPPGRGRNGAVRAPTVLASTATTNPDAYAAIPADSGEYEDVPAELRCGICQNIIRDAVRLPCCDKSFCDSCIRNLLVSDAGSSCPNCKSEVQFDQCAPDSLIRESVAKWERDMQVKRQKRKEEVLSSAKALSANKESIKKEPTSTSPASGPGSYHGVSRNNVYNRQQPSSTGRPDQSALNNRRSSAHYDDGSKSSSEPMPIGSVLGRAMPAVNASMFQQTQEGARIRPTGYPVNSFMNNNNNNNSQQRARNDVRPTPNPMGFFPPQFSDFTSYMAAFPGVMDPAAAAAFAMSRRMPGAANMAPRMPFFPPFMGVGGAQSEAMASMFKSQQQQFQRTIAAQQQQAASGGGGGSSALPGPNLRITRTPNQPKVPVLSPFDSERRSPDKPRSSDDYRDKDRRDKDDDRRRDERKYDDRDRRSGEKRRGSHDDRRSPDRRRDSSRDRKRPRIDSPERRDPKKDSSSRAEVSRQVEKEKERERPRREEIAPPSKSGGSRASEKGSDKDRDTPRETKPETTIREIKSEKTDRPPRLREPEVKTEEVEAPVPPAQQPVPVPAVKAKVEPPDSTPATVPEIKKEVPVPTVTVDVPVKAEPEVVTTPKPIERQLSAPAPKKETLSTRFPVKAPSPAPLVASKPTNGAVDHRSDAVEPVETVAKERTGDSKKERDKEKSKKDKEKPSRSSRKDHKSSKSSRDKRPRSESNDQRSARKRPDLKRPPILEKGVILEHLREIGDPDDVENSRDDRGAEKRTHKSRSKRDKDQSKSKRTSPSPEPHRESRKRESRKNSETDDVKEKERKKDRGKSDRKEKSSHKSSKSSRKEKSSKSSHDKADAEEGSSRKEKSSSKREKEQAKIVDARVVLDEQRARRGENSPSRYSDRDREFGDGSRKKSDPVDSRRGSDEVTPDDAGKVKSSRSHKSKKERSEKSKSSRDKHSSRSSPGEKKRHKKKHRREKRDADGVKSPVGDEDMERKSDPAEE